MIRPILFNTEMVRAILNGRKTVTRRAIKPNQEIVLNINGFRRFPQDMIAIKHHFFFPYCEMKDEELIQASYKSDYKVGDILWVRETWSEWTDGYLYRAWNEPFPQPSGENIKWHPSIHMPKEAARIFLKVTDVRVERLQDITEEEVLKEGIRTIQCRECNAVFGCDRCIEEGTSEVNEFSQLWNSTINKSDINRYGWEANPYVWVIEFERCEKPEDF